jgi:hypothetical protein
MSLLSNLESGLNKALDDFKNEITFILETSESPVSVKNDIEEVSKQVFYTFNEFKQLILHYLKKC